MLPTNQSDQSQIKEEIVKDRFEQLGFDTNSINISKGIVNNDIIIP